MSTNFMQDIFANGVAVDVVLTVIALEFVVLLILRRARLRQAAIDLFFALMPGVMLLVALRLALVGAAWPWIAGTLATSFPFHLVDLARRRPA